jgi:lysophospholipase L1-like esterase
MRHLVQSLAKALGLVLLVLLGAEAGLWFYADGAFIEPNFYQHDDALRITLIPDSQMRLSYLGVEPYTTVRINSAGFRGEELPAPSTDEVVVIGDSLSFGLGVEYDQTFSALLQERLGGKRTVLNLGVPSYLMHEQTQIVQRVLTERTPARIIYALSVCRMLGGQTMPPGARFHFDNGWLIAGKTGNVQVPLPLPSSMMRSSHIVNLIRQTMRDPSREAFTRRVVEERADELLAKAERASAERARLHSAGWFELMGPDGSPRSWSTLLPELRSLKASMAGSDTRLTLLLLPQDFVLHEAAWDKYKLAPIDTTAVQLLIEDLHATAQALGLDLVDASGALHKAGPQTTLPRDWHFSPLGHQVIAQVLTDHLTSTADSPVKMQPHRSGR